MGWRPPDPPLADAVVSLRPLALTDVASVEAALLDPEICRWFDNRGVTAREVVERAVARWQAEEGAEFAVLDAGECVGSLWLTLGAHSRATVGYWLLQGARGKGLAAHALVLVSRWGFDELGVKRIGLLADPRNVASARVAARAGFQREGVLRCWADVNGERVDHVSFSLLPTDSRDL
jgi:[ribosomal protein S5]-alanine N-acetyltransferase